MEDWIDILRRAVATHGGNLSAVSRALVGNNSKRPAISQALAGKYFGTAGNLEKLVRDRFERVECPYLRTTLPIADCRAVWDGPTPTHDPAALAHRRACRSCSNKPQGEQP